MSKRKQATRPLIQAPATIPEETIIALVPIPDSADWKRLLLGGLRVLAAWTNYMPTGATREVDTANAWKDIINMVTFKEFCEQLIDCLENDEDTQEALREVMSGLGFGQSDGGNSTGTPYDGITGQTIATSCDESELYGNCLAIVSGLNRLSLDCLEIIEVLTNPGEVAAQLATKVPVLGSTLGLVVEFAAWMQDVIAESYAAAYTVETAEAWACRIYCLCIDDCAVTIEKVIQAYDDGIVIYGPPPIDSPFEDIVIWLSGLTSLASEAIVGAMHYFILHVMIRAGDFYGANYRALEVYAGEGTPIEPECDCPETTWCMDFDFTVSTHGWTLNEGTWIDGEGYAPAQHTAAGQRENRAFIQYALGGEFNFTKMQIYFHADVVQNNATFPVATVIEALNSGIDGFGVGETAVSRSPGYSLTWDGDADATDVYARVGAGSKNGTGAFSPAGNAGDCRLTRIHCEGVGTNPFGSDNC